MAPQYPVTGVLQKQSMQIVPNDSSRVDQLDPKAEIVPCFGADKSYY